MAVSRCAWAKATSTLEVDYHDHEWGVPSFDDRHLFEMLILEGAQAGLSWRVILEKREGYRRAFDGFNAERMARYTTARKNRLLQDPGIVRNRLKVEAAVTNARAYLDLVASGETLADFLWAFVDGVPLQNRWATPDRVPASTPQSDAMSRELKRRGFKFVGSTICYALMQAVGMVNDHTVNCFRHAQLHS
ncbi:MAG: DNA-3-methyladenine glycosylase I [Gammaproteobacteria bacterium]|nr:DNA-3-methyladenine glycosylase I [Gammaproteobacteria bacterium]MDJ0872012.1 DNA-3-methyladenine glycosylase I [Gammaproteobacteria bacterium]